MRNLSVLSLRHLPSVLLPPLLLAACGDGGGGGHGPSPTAPHYTVGGSVSGLTGTLVLRNNGGDDRTLTTNGGFVFATTLADGSLYNVTIAGQPAGQTCSISNGSGMVSGANTTNIGITCTINPGATTWTIGGTVNTLAGTLKLRNNNGNETTVTASGAFTFSGPVNDGGNYSVTISAQPTGQTCSISNGSGVATADVTNVTVNCASNQYAIGGTVSGLVGGASHALVLRNNGGDDLALASDGTFAFITPVAYNTGYNVTVIDQPPGQSCEVDNASGVATGHIDSVQVICTTLTYSIGGAINGLSGSLQLLNNGTDGLVRSGDGLFAFATAVPYNGLYNVTVGVQPSGQICTVNNGSGTVLGTVDSISVSCVNGLYHIGGTVSGLTGTLSLQTDGGDSLTVNANGAFQFSSAVPHGSIYRVSVQTQPAGQSCVVNHAIGTIDGADATAPEVVCGTAAWKIGGTVTGLAGTLVLQNNGDDNHAVSLNGNFAFPTYVIDGGAYDVTVLTQPSGQTCSLTNQSGTAIAAVSTVTISCSNHPYRIGGTVSGLAGGAVTLQDNGGDDLVVNSDGAFVFATPVLHSQPYEVSVLSQPAGLICVVDGGTGTVSGADIDTISVLCVDENSAPSIPVLNLGTTSNPRELVFTWPAAAGSTYYRLEKSADGNPPWVQVGPDLVTTQAREVISVHRHDWDNIRYRLQACNPNGCQASSPVSSAARELHVIGYFKADQPGSGDNFGTSVALSDDGRTMAVGAHCESSVPGNPADDSLPCAGAVYLFERASDASWHQVAFLKAPQADVEDFFGGRLALSADGNTLAVAASSEDSAAIGINGVQADDSANGAGAVYVYSRSGGIWQTTPVYIKPGNTDAGDNFGIRLALSADGDTLAVGAYGEDGNGSDPADNSAPGAGAAYVFIRSAGNWSQQAYLKAANPDSEDLFGLALALSADGNTLAVGGLGEDSNATTIDGNDNDESAALAGAAWVFTRNGSSWSQQAYLKARNAEALDRFGSSLAMSADGNLLAVGAHGERGNSSGVNGDDADNSLEFAGAAYVFARNGSSWSQQAYLKAGQPDASDFFGTALALSADGSTLAVGAFSEDSNAVGIDGDGSNDSASTSGAVYLFDFDGSQWTAGVYVKASNTEALDYFGVALALSADGNELAVGAVSEGSAASGVQGAGGGSQSDNSAAGAGAVYLY